MTELDPIDGGPAFPMQDGQTIHAYAAAKVQHISDVEERDRVYTLARAAAVGGMSKRELFAAILMHGDLVTCGVPGEAADALVEASRASGDDVVDHMASNAVEAADALLRALGAPRPVQYRRLYADEQMRIDAADRLASTVTAMQECPEYAALPAGLRTQIERDLADVNDPEIPF